MRESSVDAGGTRLYFREDGAGPPVVLLHGFPQTGHCWRLVAPALAQRFRVVIPDLPGMGWSQRPASFDLPAIARTIVSFLDEVGAERARIVGHDWGGGIAYRLALDHPERVEQLAVVNSPFRELDLKRGWHMLFLNLPVLPELAFTVGRNQIVDLAHRLGSANRENLTPDVLDHYRKALHSLERQRAAFAYYRTATREAIRRGLPWAKHGGGPRRSIAAPTMIVWGARDPVLPTSLLHGIKRDIPHARIEEIEDAGHFVPEERPDRLAELLLEFFG